MESKTILFHSNEEERCQTFIENDSLIISGNDKDDIWLGTGMYFWDNRGNVKWWNENQKKKHPEKSYSILQVNACTDRMLDLTDVEVYKSTKEIWDTLCKVIRKNPNVPLGNKLNTLYDIYDSWQIDFPVIKLYGKYKKMTNNDGIFTFDYYSKKAEPMLAVRCIYNVKSAGCILEKEILKEENHEQER